MTTGRILTAIGGGAVFAVFSYLYEGNLGYDIAIEATIVAIVIYFMHNIDIAISVKSKDGKNE